MKLTPFREPDIDEKSTDTGRPEGEGNCGLDTDRRQLLSSVYGPDVQAIPEMRPRPAFGAMHIHPHDVYAVSNRRDFSRQEQPGGAGLSEPSTLDRAVIMASKRLKGSRDICRNTYPVWDPTWRSTNFFREDAL